MGQDTLRHIKNGESLLAYSAPIQDTICGFTSGQNCEGWEMYAEKYLIPGSGKITGIEIFYRGKISGPNRRMAFDIYNVANNGLPGDTLTRKYVTYRNLVANGNPYYLEFDTAAMVKDSFFVGINFLNYAHEALTDTIAILTTPNFSRPERDLQVYGRNAVKQHHLPWKDFYGHTSYRLFFGMHPIGDFDGAELFSRDTTSLNIVAEEDEEYLRTVYYEQVNKQLVFSNETKGIDVYIINSIGSEVGHYKAGNRIIDTGSLSPGFYTVVLAGENRTVKRKLIIY